MGKLKYTFKTDTLFKILFVKYPHLLKSLVAELLKIDIDSIEHFEIANTEIAPENIGDKFCRLDVNMVVDGRLVDLEIEVKDKGAYPERVLYYWAREYSSAIVEGDKYAGLPQTVHISIVGFPVFDCLEFHSEFQALEVTRHTPLTDKMSLHFFELLKLPETVSKDNMLELWLSLFRANTEEELMKIEAMGIPEMKEAIVAYRNVAASPEFHEVGRLRSKARHDEAQALYHAGMEGEIRGEAKGIKKGKKEQSLAIAKNLLKAEMPIDKIAEVTGLTIAEVEALRE